jgi:hypothetical protein
MRHAPALLLFLGALARAGAQDLTLITYNIRYDNPADSLDRWDLRKDAVARVVRDLHPQVIGLQEALSHQLTYLDAQWPSYRRFGVGREDGVTKGEFGPVYFDTTVFSLLDGRTIWLSETPDAPGKGWDAACERIATLVMLRDKTKGDSLLVVNTHWDHVGAEARRHSADLLLNAIAPAIQEGTNVILMGDLNATPDQAPIILLAEFLVNACPEDQAAQGTFNGFKLDGAATGRIDHIWLSPSDWSVQRYSVPQPRVNGRQVSDHYPVVVDLRMH